MQKSRIAFINTHPIQYFAPLYAYLNRTGKFAVTALYLSDYSIRGSTGSRSRGTETAAPARTMGATRPGAARRGADARFSHRFMDAAPSGEGDRATDGGTLSSRSCLENSEGDELDHTAAS